jgi:hypothetical protein
LSVKLMTIVWELALPSADKLVLLALADNASDEGKCYPSIHTLVKKCSLSERTIQRTLVRLTDDGHLTSVMRTGRSTVYTVHPRQDDTPVMVAPRHGGTPVTPTPPSTATKTPVMVAPTPVTVTPTPVTMTPITITQPSPNLQKPSGTSSCELDKRTQVDTLSDVYEVFGHWQKVWNHPKAVLDPKRRARIRSRLKEFTVAQLCNAISGFRNSAWHTGEDPKGDGTVYDGIETLLRDAAQVEKGIGLLERPPIAPAELSPIDRIALANGLPVENHRASRIVEHRSSSRDLEGVGRDVRRELGTGFRKIGS